MNPFGAWASDTITNHKRRGFIVNISIFDLKQIAKETKICKYCSGELKYGYGSKGKTVSLSPSLDRTDNEKELNIKNTQIICYNCNATKRSRTHDEFISYCKNIASKF